MKKTLTLFITFILSMNLHAASLTGQVFDQNTNEGIENVRVHLWFLNWTPDSMGVRHYVDFTDSNGQYELLNLNDGLYTLLAWSFSGYQTFSIDEIDIMTDVVLNIPLTPLPGTGFVSGQVYEDITGDPLSNHFLKFLPLDEHGVWQSAWTDSLGNYSVGLSEGDYYAMCFQFIQDSITEHSHHDSSSHHFSYFEFFDDVQNIELASTIAIIEGETTPNIDFGLPSDFENIEPVHFTNVLNGYYDDYINFHLETDQGIIQHIIIDAVESGDIGDEIGILDNFGIPGLGDCDDTYQDEVLVGAGVWTGDPIIIPIYGHVEDCINSGLNYPGFIEGNQIEVLFWDASENNEFSINLDFSYGSPSPDAGGIYDPSVFGNQYTFLSIQQPVSIDPFPVVNALSLSKNYPNPFNPVTLISFNTPKHQTVKISILDIKGNHILELANRPFTPGFHTIQWTGINEEGTSMASGVYICILESDLDILSQKMILLK